ncbi:uncharacterized protein LOC117117999 [Anneissia japonica]|uniref:uncharacterized protein LOC117117999 n=1 Tax=Anneissia japonica TaxID=1529436 RepID=UPI001425773B|nr:uncharacterized protein LOC117117999 [Anneissia japonica]
MAGQLDCFHLKGSDGGFNTKQKDIFQQLESLETKYKNDLVKRFSTDDDEDNKGEHRDVDGSASFRVPKTMPSKTTRGRDRFSGDRKEWSNNESQYRDSEYNKDKHSTWNNKRRSRQQDYSNPAKWTKYSLEDTDIGSESQNKKIAFQFLAEQRARNTDSTTNVVANLDDKITFSKPLAKEVNDTGKTNPKMYGNVFRMEECVVGAPKKLKAKTDRKPKAESMPSIHVQLDLKYLDASDEEDPLTKGKNKQEGEEKIMFRKNKQRKSIRKRDEDT